MTKNTQHPLGFSWLAVAALLLVQLGSVGASAMQPNDDEKENQDSQKWEFVSHPYRVVTPANRQQTPVSADQMTQLLGAFQQQMAQQMAQQMSAMQQAMQHMQQQTVQQISVMQQTYTQQLQQTQTKVVQLETSNKTLRQQIELMQQQPKTLLSADQNLDGQRISKNESDDDDDEKDDVKEMAAEALSKPSPRNFLASVMDDDDNARADRQKLVLIRQSFTQHVPQPESECIPLDHPRQPNAPSNEHARAEDKNASPPATAIKSQPNKPDINDEDEKDDVKESSDTRLRIVRLFGGLTSSSALCQAVWSNNEAQALRALRDPNVAVSEKCTEKKATPLHLAAFYGNARISQALLDAGVDKDAATNEGATALHAAAFSPSKHAPRVLQTLLDAGLDKDAAINGGMTALHLAAANTSVHAPQVVQILL
ncbi:MAG: ankyrin repeat domain-containing protein, partial [Myxococcota bacterium]